MMKEETMEHSEWIEVLGARVHNLKNIDVRIPRNSLTVITGPSGSGKSSLAFDTLYAEGQRRYMETLSSYARQFLGLMERPDVDKITGLSPVIAIEQKTVNKNPRSTVGTITEIYDFLRLLFARTAIAYSYHTNEPMVKYTEAQIVNLIQQHFNNRKIYLLAPLVRGRKGHYKELFDQLIKKGFLNVRVDGHLRELTPGMKIDRYKTHYIELVVDKLHVQSEDDSRLSRSVATAMKMGKGVIMVYDKEDGTTRYYSKKLMCPSTGLSYDDPAPHTFSFNSPQGACPRCNGLGYINEADIKKIIPNPRLSIKQGAIKPLGSYRNSLIFWQLEAIGTKYGFSLSTPVKDIPDEALNVILYGSDEPFRLSHSPLGSLSNYVLNFDGLINYLSQQANLNENGDNFSDAYFHEITCPECNGARLKKEALYFRLADKNIAELSQMSLKDLAGWFDQIEKKLTPKQIAIGSEIIKEIRSRLKFLLDVGLDYLSLNRSSRTLSGGESQRIRLATQIGSQLVNVLYILDEPSIGLHPRDNHRLIDALKNLRDNGNSIIVVEHDKEMMQAADYLVDIGPGAGKHGGEIIAAGPPAGLLKKGHGITIKYLKEEKKIPVPAHRHKGNGKKLILRGACGNNLKHVTAEFPLGTFICVTGVSGSGKTSLITDTLYPVLSRHLYGSQLSPLPYESMEGIEHINKVIVVDQSPIGKTPRSNPATYTGVFTDIRKLYEQTPDARIRGFTASRFSFNVKGGRCETCKGAGVQTIEMNFLPDVYVTCPDCQGQRYNRETLEVKYKGQSINDVLEMTIDQAVEFFHPLPSLYKKLKVLSDVGLGYIKLGQPSTTLSGGEAQRIKLAAELSRTDTGKTLYILDEPTTGLHFDDIRMLLDVLNHLRDKGNTILVIEHNLDIIKSADYIIDLGKEGGDEGGMIVACGTPEEICRNKNSYTGFFLKKELLL